MIKEVPNLEIDLNTQGWDKSGGKSNNVWGQVPFPQEIIDVANEAKIKSIKYKRLMGREEIIKPSIWTAYDQLLYANNDPITRDDLPATISATFKSCYSNYTAIIENMCMRIAFALNLPTSYNYIVKFDPNEYPKIVGNYPSMSTRDKVSRLGIVSIDFLQPGKAEPKYDEYEEEDEFGVKRKVLVVDDVMGDELKPFDDIVVKVIGNNRLSGDQNLIENWVAAVDRYVQDEMKDLPRERVNKILHDVHSRIARSFLLKEYCGDCDNTSYNSTTVLNRSKRMLRYGPNHDFGDGFNKLLKTKILKTPPIPIEQINMLPEVAKQKMLSRWEREQKESVADIARQFAVKDTSERNFLYILEHFPDSAKEFFESIDRCVGDRVFDKIVNSYVNMSCDGKAIMTRAEAAIFKEYLAERSAWMAEMYIDYLREHPQSVSLF